MNWDDALERYLNRLRGAGKADGTVRLHRHYVRAFARTVATPRDATLDTIIDWLGRPGWAPETRRSGRMVVTNFYQWAARVGVVPVDPTIGLDPVRVPVTRPRPAPQAVFNEAMLRADREERLMLKLARYCGLRCGEIATIHSRDLDGDMLYVRGKGGKERVVPVMRADLRKAIIHANGWLFPSQRGEHISPGWVSKRCARILPGTWTAHKLRTAFATKAYAKTHDVFGLGLVLGHSRPETTLRYVGIENDALRRITRAAA